MTGHGGRRPGAGRKPKALKYEPAITAAEQQIVDRLPRLLDRLLYLAEGGYEQVEEEYQRAELLADDNDETPVVTDQTTLVLVKRKVSIAAPDRASITYLVDRILGKTPQHVELTGEDGGPVEITPVVVTMAKQELAEWQRQQMSAMQLSLPNALLTPPMPAIPTE